MSNFDWLFVGLISIAIVTGAIALLMLTLLIKDWKKIPNLKVRRPKNKSKRKRWIKLLRRMERKRSVRIKAVLLCLFSVVICSGSAVYGKYYQATNLGEADAANIARSYNLITSLEVEIEKVTLEDNQEQSKLDLDVLNKKLSSFGNKRASMALTQEGQLMLNRYYNQISQLGSNLNQDLGKFFTDEQLRDVYKQDIKKINNQQKKVFEYYSIDETALIGKAGAGSQE